MASSAYAQAPSLMSYQGRLLQGTNLVNGNVGMALRLYNVSSGGSILYADVNVVTVTDGLYSTFIGDGSVSGDLHTALTNSQVWLETVVNGATLTPRERLASAAYSLSTRGWRVSTNAEPSLTGNPEFNTMAGNSVGSVIGGGVGNVVSGSVYSVVAGGKDNQNLSVYGAIGGGQLNVVGADADHATIVGGRQNTIGADAYSSVIVGGYNNTILPDGELAVVLGGYSNRAVGYAYAAGIRAHALHRGSFVWADVAGSANVFASTASNQFLIRVAGGVGINTNAPQATLDVNGSVRVGGGSIFNRMVEGTAVLGSGTNTMSYSVVFPTAFTSTPKVIVSPRNDPVFDVVDTFGASVRKVTLTNFVVNVHRIDSTGGWAQQLRLDWIAWH